MKLFQIRIGFIHSGEFIKNKCSLGVAMLSLREARQLQREYSPDSLLLWLRIIGKMQLCY